MILAKGDFVTSSEPKSGLGIIHLGNGDKPTPIPTICHTAIGFDAGFTCPALAKGVRPFYIFLDCVIRLL